MSPFSFVSPFSFSVPLFLFEPTIDWLLEHQDEVQHYYHQLGLEGEL
jgi:hypothetical protein